MYLSKFLKRGIKEMAKPESYRLDKAKRTIILYTNKEPNQMEQLVINSYISNGFDVKFETKKDPLTVAQMREQLSENQLEEFDRIYKSKDKDEGFHLACKYYALIIKIKKLRKKLTPIQLQAFNEMYKEDEQSWDKVEFYINTLNNVILKMKDESKQDKE